MKHQRLTLEGVDKHGTSSTLLFIPVVSRQSRKSPIRFVIFCVIFVSLYFLIYSPLSAWTSNPGIPPNLTWVIQQRETFLKILQPQNVTALMLPNGDFCSTQRLLTVVVCSAASNEKARETIRMTWGRDSQKDSRVVFLIGRPSSNDTKLLDDIEAEAERHEDMIQEDFIDTYNNLTLKSAFMLKWASQSGCAASSRFILKTDDDMYINIPNLVSLLKTKARRGMLIGCLIKKAQPVHDIKSKWYVPGYVFSERYYPNYLSGTGYILATDTVNRLLKVLGEVPFFHLEDIYVTGLLARRAGLSRLNHEGFKFYKRKTNVCLFRKLITAHMMKPSEIESMYSAVNDHRKICR